MKLLKKRNSRILALLLVVALVVSFVPQIFASTLDEHLQDAQILGESELELQLGTSNLVASAGPSTYGLNEGISKAKRDIVMVLDRSWSMTQGGLNEATKKPLIEMKKAAIKFVEGTLESTVETRIAIVTFSTDITIAADFTTDGTVLTNAINAIGGGTANTTAGGTNTGLGIETAKDLIAAGRYDAKKIMIVLSDGEAQSGDQDTSATAKYKKPMYPNAATHAFASAVFNKAEAMKSTTDIYSLGFFHNLTGDGRDLCAQMSQDISNKGYHDVENGDDLGAAFDNIIDDLMNTSRIVVIPDAMGSILYGDAARTQMVWPPTSVANIASDLDMSKTLYPISPMTSTRGIYGANNLYGHLMKSISRMFPTRELYFFSYDFRLSNEENAAELYDFLQNDLTLYSGETVDIVAHGTGGLIVAQYVQNYPTPVGEEDLFNVIITAGTAFEGAPSVTNAVTNWNNPTAFPGGTVNDPAEDLKGLPAALKASLVGVGELSPTEKYVNGVQFYKRGATPTAKTPIDYAEYKGYMENIYGATVYSDIVAAQDNISADVLAALPNSYFMYGSGAITPTAAVFDTDSTGVTEVVDLEFDTLGDGTIPYESATMMGEVKNMTDAAKHNYLFTQYNHNELIGSDPSKTMAIDWILRTLQIKTSIENLINPLTGRPYIIIRIACPVDVTITDEKGVALTNKATGINATSFGTVYQLGGKDDVKLFALEEDKAYKIHMDATDSGTMDYAIRFMSKDGTLEERSFTDVPLTATTKIDTTSDQAVDSMLYVDTKGTGTYDLVLEADGKKVVDPPVVDPPVVVPPKDNNYYGTGNTDGTSKRDTVITVGSATKAFNKAEATKTFKEALAKKPAGQATLSVRAYNYGAVDAAALKEIQTLSKAAGVKTTIYFDTVEAGKVVQRIKVNPDVLLTALNLKTTLTGLQVKTSLAKTYKNKLEVVNPAQKATTRLDMAVRVEGATQENVKLYTVDLATSQFFPATGISYIVDDSGYVHFTTDSNNIVVVSVGTLAKK